MCSGKGEVDKIRSDTAQLKQQVGEINRKLDQPVPNASPAPTSAPTP